jgi:thymidylate synthase
MKDGFPLLTTKKMAWKQIVTELLWFLRGDTNIKYLVDNNCHIWDGDAYKEYFTKKSNEKGPFGISGLILTKEEFINEIKTDDEFAKKYGELGSIYGKQWRSWEGKGDYRLPEKVSDWVYTESGLPVTKYQPKQIDQIANLISELKTNPDSRRLIVSAWNVSDVESGSMVLPPCHYGFQVYTRELTASERMKLAGYEDVGGIGQNIIRETVDMDNTIPRRAISLMYNCRSQDVPLGTPFNISSYALLLEIIAKQVNMVPDQLIGNLGDCHIYLNQIDGVKEQLTREPYPLPTVKISDRVVNDISEYTLDDIILENYQSHPTIKMPLSN